MNITPSQAASSLMYVLPNLMQILATRMKIGKYKMGSQIHARTLMWLSTHDSCRMSDLAERFHMSRPAMTACIQALVARGFVTRQRRSDDRRVVEIVLTPDGRTQIESWAARISETLEDELSVLSADDLETVVASMDILASVFGIESWVRGEQRLVFSSSCKGETE